MGQGVSMKLNLIIIPANVDSHAKLLPAVLFQLVCIIKNSIGNYNMLLYKYVLH